MFDQSQLTLASTIFQKLGISLRNSVTSVVLTLFCLSGLSFSLVGSYYWWQMQGQQRQTQELVVQAVAAQQHQQTKTQPHQIQVYVAGAVKHSGVYLLEEGERVGQLIEKAGGFSTAASSSYVNQQLNLARKLTDGEQIYVPTANEQQLSVAQQPTIANENSNDLISINTAATNELETLPGIGPKRAEDIINDRPYIQIDDLVTKDVVTQSIFDEIKTQIAP